METSELAQRYVAAVEGELGVIAKVDDEGDVVFKVPQAGTLFIGIDEKDPSFFHLVFPDFGHESYFNNDRNLMYYYANEITRTTKVAKVILQERNQDLHVTATAEMFIGAPGEVPTDDMIRSIIVRGLAVVLRVATEFDEYARLHIAS